MYFHEVEQTLLLIEFDLEVTKNLLELMSVIQ